MAPLTAWDFGGIFGMGLCAVFYVNCGSHDVN